MITLYGDKLSFREFVAVVVMWLCYGAYALTIFVVSWWWLDNTLPTNTAHDVRTDVTASRAVVVVQDATRMHERNDAAKIRN